MIDLHEIISKNGGNPEDIMKDWISKNTIDNFTLKSVKLLIEKNEKKYVVNEDEFYFVNPYTSTDWSKVNATNNEVVLALKILGVKIKRFGDTTKNAVSITELNRRYLIAIEA